VSVTDVGVPKIGVTNVGDVASTTLPLPVVPFDKSPAAGCTKLGAALEPVLFPKNVCAPAEFTENVRDGVVEALLTLVVNRFVALPALKFVTVPVVVCVCGFCNCQFVPSKTTLAMAVVVRSPAESATLPFLTMLFGPIPFTVKVAALVFAASGRNRTL